jgi:hypothetical protein
MKRRRRCQSFTPEQRIAILKQVGRYISDPSKPHKDIESKELGRYIEPQFQNQNGGTNLLVSNNDSSKGDRTRSTTEEALVKLEEENSRTHVRQLSHGQIQHKGLTLVPRGKRLTICTKCNKPGYKYRTYFQHYNEPPIGKVKLKGNYADKHLM